MSDREKTLIAFLIVAILTVIGLVGALMVKDKENERYKTILDVSCQRTYNASQCKAGMKMLMNMSPEEIKNYGSFGF